MLRNTACSLVPGQSPGAGDLFFFGRLRRLLRGSGPRAAQRAPQARAPSAPRSWGACLCAWTPEHMKRFSEMRSDTQRRVSMEVCAERSAGEGAWRAWRRCAVTSVGAVRPIGWEGSRSEREGTRVRGEGGAAGPAAREAAESLGVRFFPNRQSWSTDRRRISRFQS